MIIYDCEIVKAIPPKDGSLIDGIEYCDGWRDFENMGISVIGAYDYVEDRYRIFCEDNFGAFQDLADSADLVVGFNSIAFDNALCAASGITVPKEKSYDILVETWKAHGLGPKFVYPSHMGFSLDAIAASNLQEKKSGNGAMAPVDWQQGRIGSVIDYCLQDVRLTKRLMDMILEFGQLISPKTNELVDIDANAIKALRAA